MILTNCIVTAYCACRLCIGSHSANPVTAIGKKPLINHTIAAPRNIPLGTRVAIGDRTYLVEDRTARRYNNRWDIYVSSHQEAIIHGKVTNNITIYP